MAYRLLVPGEDAHTRRWPATFVAEALFAVTLKFMIKKEDDRLGLSFGVLVAFVL
jgi:hypothetical protein